MITVGVHKPGAQGRLVVFADALGFAGISLITLQVLTSGRWAITTRHLMNASERIGSKIGRVRSRIRARQVPSPPAPPLTQISGL